MRIPSHPLLSLWPYGLLLLVVAGLYSQSLGFGYVWDDHTLFLDSTLLREGVWSWASVARPVLPDTPYFRPLVLSTWMAEMQLFRLTPLYSHAVNVALHGISTCLFFAVASRMFVQYRGGRNAALLAALLYAAHPCLIEGVAWISGRFDLLATALLLAGFVVAMAPASVVRCLFVAVLALGAMLSKETGVLFGPLLVLLTLARDPKQPLRTLWRSLWPYLLAYTLAVAMYFALRSSGLGFSSYKEFGLSQLLESVLRYEQWLRTLSFYTFISFNPFSAISPRHDLSVEMTSYRQHAVALIAAFLLMLTVVWFALKRRTWALLWLGFYVGIFPVLGIFVINLGETIGADRFLYLPLVLLTLAVVALFLEIRERFSGQRELPVLGVTLSVAWLGLAFFVTYTITAMWESDLRLWSWQYRTNPGNTLVRTAYVSALSKTKGPQAAKEFAEEIERIRKLHGGQLPLTVQMVYAGYLLERNDPESLLYLRGLVENAPRVWPNIENDDAKQGDRVLYFGVLSNYTQALMVYEGDLVGAREYLTRAQRIAPRGGEYNIIHQMIALEYLEGNEDAARSMYHKHLGVLQAYNLRKSQEAMRSLVAFTCLRKQGNDCHAYANRFLSYLQEKSD